MTRRLHQGVQNTTVNNERAILSKLMLPAVEWERIPDNRVGKVRELELPTGRLRFFTHDEADRLLNCTPRHLKPIAVTALETGGRLSEVLGLRWKNIHLERRLLSFDQTNTKNDPQREIPITDVLAATLADPTKVRSIHGDAREYIFTVRGKRLRTVQDAFRSACKRARLGRDVTFHTLRHSFASWYAMRGGDLYRLRTLLGHQDMKTTMACAHLSPKYMRAAVGLMGR